MWQLRSLRRIFLIFNCLWLTQCASVHYYGQAILGQGEILNRARPISEWLAQPDLSPALRQRLQAVQRIRLFAIEKLSLPDNDSYTEYVDLERPYVVWSVFATPAFSLQPKSWCFYVVGCVSYRGYFAEKNAQELAISLENQGFDVYVAGVSAYSTLGWLPDPLLNTLLKWDDVRLAEIIFHELAHQQLYISDDTAFNEGFAVAVEEIGIERWLAAAGTAAQREQYILTKQREKDFIRLVLATRQALEQLYESGLAAALMQEKKSFLFKKLQADYAVLKQQWGGYAGYDKWFATGLNNAKIAAVVTYQDYVPAFHALFLQMQGDLPAFYAAVANLGNLSPAVRRVRLQEMLKISSD